MFRSRPLRLKLYYEYESGSIVNILYTLLLTVQNQKKWRRNTLQLLV